MKKILLFLAIVISIATKAQVTKVNLQASGLTCSMCSNAINKALRSLDFVDKVDANIKNYIFEISFKDARQVDFDKIRKKVEDAGFFVSSFRATIYFNNVQVVAGKSITLQNYTLLFVGSVNQPLNGERQVKILDKGFITAKEYKSSAISESPAGTGLYHVSL